MSVRYLKGKEKWAVKTDIYSAKGTVVHQRKTCPCKVSRGYSMLIVDTIVTKTKK